MESKKICNLHGLELQPVQVGITYGMINPTDIYWGERSKLFPNAQLQVNGGCVFGSRGDSVDVLFCSECREIETAWRKEHNRELPSVEFMEQIFRIAYQMMLTDPERKNTRRKRKDEELPSS